MGKKRKPEMDLDLERSLYSTFVAAANSVSSLYTQAQQQQKRAHIDGQRQALEKVVGWLAHEHGNGQPLSAHNLLEYLRFELQHLEAADQQCAANAQPQLFQHQNPNTGGPSPAKRLDLSSSAFGFGLGGGGVPAAADVRAAGQGAVAFGAAGGGASGMDMAQQHLQQQLQQHVQQQQQQFGSFGGMGGQAGGQ